MILTILNQFANFEYKLGHCFEWLTIFGPLYFAICRKYMYGTLIFSTQACDRREGEHGVCRLAFPQSEFCQSATNLLAKKVNIWVDIGCVAERDQRMLSLSWALSQRGQCTELLRNKAKLRFRCNVFRFSGLSSWYQTYQTNNISFHSLILALGNPRVDLLSLDIEGAEYLVLQTLPWEKVEVTSTNLVSLFLIIDSSLSFSIFSPFMVWLQRKF